MAEADRSVDGAALRLAELEARHRIFFEEGSYPMAVLEVAPDGTLSATKEVNDAVCELYGLSREEIVDKIRPGKFEIPEDRPKIAAAAQELLTTGRARTEVRQELPDGRRLTIEISSWMYDVGGKKKILAVFRDRTARDKAREQIRRSEELIRAITRSAEDAIFVKDTGLHYTFANESMARLLDRRPEDILGRTAAEVFGDEAAEVIAKVDRPVLQGETVDAVETLTIRNRRLTFHTVQAPLFDSDGKVTGVCGIVRDISKMKQAEAALRDSEMKFRESTQLLEALFDAIPDVIGIQDPEHHVVRYNRAGYEFLRQTPDGVAGCRCYELIGKDRPCEECATSEVYQTLRPARREKFIAAMDVWLDCRAYPILDNDGKLVRVIEHLRDITEQKKAEAEIHKLNEELEERVKQRTTQLEAANRELESFAYSVSHDLRAPLRHMAGFAGMLEEQLGDSIDETTADCVKRIARAAERMSTLIDDLLTFSRMTRAELRCSPFELSALFAEVREEVLQEADELTVEWDVGELPRVDADRSLMRQVLYNLFSNALKFSAGRDVVRIGFQVRQEGKSYVFRVADNGVGFDPRYQSKLFQIFQRLHSQDEFPGTGIGLANVQRIISRHGGKVWAEGEPGKGATFFFSIPAVRLGR